MYVCESKAVCIDTSKSGFNQKQLIEVVFDFVSVVNFRGGERIDNKHTIILREFDRKMTKKKQNY